MFISSFSSDMVENECNVMVWRRVTCGLGCKGWVQSLPINLRRVGRSGQTEKSIINSEAK